MVPDHVGVQGALNEVIGIGQIGGHLFEDPDECLTDDLALLLRIGDPGQPLQETVLRVDVNQIRREVPPEGLFDLFALAESHEPVVDEDAGELTTDRLLHQGGRHRRVDPARKPADDVP